MLRLQPAAKVAKILRPARARRLETPWFHCCRGKRQFSEESVKHHGRKPLYPLSGSEQSHSTPIWGELTTSAGQTTPYRRRQAMTNQEINTFNDMFNMIFDAISEQDKSPDDVQLQQNDIGQLFTKLRRHNKRKWTTDEQHDLDHKKEQMERCNTDQELLQWAMTELFEDSLRREAAAREAILEAEKSGKLQDIPRLQSPSYANLLSVLIKTFRERYNDPHLALAMFDHARNLSIVSYVFGCNTMAYNELIKTRWDLRDLQGVHDALQEMASNGVIIDKYCVRLVDKILQEAGSRSLWTEEDPVGSGDEVWMLVRKIEKMVHQHSKTNPDLKSKSSSSKQQVSWDDWKSSPMEDDADDEFGFDKWEDAMQGGGRKWDL